MSNIEFIGKSHYSKEVINQEIIGLVQGRLIFIKEEIKNLHTDIITFQKIYKKSNDVFLQEFQNGILGDDEDFFVWSSSIDILKELTEEEKILKDLQ